MTVCIAVICRWQYAPDDDGWAIITASDRMLTAGDIEFEPYQTKFGQITPRVGALIAGELPAATAPLSGLFALVGRITT